MRKELAKTYDPKAVEEKIYQNWLDKKYFHAKADETKEPYTIVIPPPNITGILHIGHALNNSIQDIIIRAKRMQGYNALWLPGTDHASIATEARIVKAMAQEGLTKQDVGRDEFLRRAWAWYDENGSTIVRQLKKLGSSCDWDRLRFTMDEGLSDAVLEVFVRLYEKGYIYRGEKLVNWCPHCKTTISDAEVDHEDKDGTFYHFKYPLADGSGEFLHFVTSRPETMLGDTAIAVNPEDERYTRFVGKSVAVPIVNRVIPVIADGYVDKDFGTGVVKITPAHDPNDFEVGERHNLPRVNIFNDDGTVNNVGGAKYEGLDRFEARKRITEEFKELGLFIKTEPVKHAVGVHERCGKVVEPALKVQWFVRMEELARPAIEAFKQDKLRFYPERFGKIYLHWLENIRDWCISRQLWWGHRIPAWHCADCGHITVTKTGAGLCAECGSANIAQDTDTLDTWFSSALWPFSTLGWPKETPELKYFYPTNVLVTAYEIIFFWVVRMVFSGLEFMGEVPFRDVYINGIVRDDLGRKMSKSLDNGIDPLEMIGAYGADALRLTLIMGNATGNDMRFHQARIESARNFNNKLWNASRFILMNLEESDPLFEPDRLTSADKWIISRANRLAAEVKAHIDGYELGMAAEKAHYFVWDEFCDWYIEMVKPRLYNREDGSRGAALWTLRNTLIKALKLLHPFLPFITEEIFLSVQDAEETIMLSQWPEFDPALDFPADESAIELVKSAIKGIRNIRAEMNVPLSRKTALTIVTENPAVREMFEKESAYLHTLGYSSEVSFGSEKPDSADMVSIMLPEAALYIPFADLVDISRELERLNKEKIRLEKETALAESKLSNPGFAAKAPESLVAAEREKLAKYRQTLAQVTERIDSLSK